MDHYYGPPWSSTIAYGPTNQRLIIAFDLHRVIFHRDFLAMARYLIGMHHKGAALRLALNPWLWYTVKKMRRTTTVGDEIYDGLVQHFPSLALFHQDFITLENMQQPDWEVVAILGQLKQQGYKLYILSNIGERTFAHFIHLFPTIFALFDHTYIPRKDNAYRQKPSPLFYKDFIAYTAEQGDRDKRILFVDDKKKNINSAASCGISCILFHSSKQLQATMMSLSLIG
jgi:FMN phosphatase YigB (HAD superfamily)